MCDGLLGNASVSGPNYNKKWDEADLKHSVRKAYHVARTAEAYLATATPLEQGLIKAIQHRVPTDRVIEDFAAVNKVDAMRRVYREFGGEDRDVITLFADALMNISPWGFFEASTGKPILSTPVWK